MWKLNQTYVQKGEVEFPYLSFLGGHNDIPEPYKVISYKEYFQDEPTYKSKYRDTRQIFNDNGKMVKGISIEFKHNYAYGVMKDYESNTIKFLKFGCTHDMEETKLGNCWYRHTCKKCGISYEIDSSD